MSGDALAWTAERGGLALTESERRRVRGACGCGGEGRIGHRRRVRGLLARRRARVEHADAQRGVHGLVDERAQRC